MLPLIIIILNDQVALLARLGVLHLHRSKYLLAETRNGGAPGTAKPEELYNPERNLPAVPRRPVHPPAFQKLRQVRPCQRIQLAKNSALTSSSEHRSTSPAEIAQLPGEKRRASSTSLKQLATTKNSELTERQMHGAVEV